MDSAWEQEKLEARKLLENAAESYLSSARFVGRPTNGPMRPNGLYLGQGFSSKLPDNVYDNDEVQSK